MMSAEEIMSQATSSHGPSGGKSRRKYYYIAGIVVLLLVVIIPVAIVVPNNRAEKKEEDEMRDMISSTLTREGVNANGLSNSGSYQGKAFNWVFENRDVKIFESGDDEMDRSQLLQRYALATFYYATHKVQTLYTPNPPSWKSSTNWLSNTHECEWQGVQCTDRGRVDGIVLEENHLTGAIPGDLVLLKVHLITLDVTTNLLYMDASHFSVFEKMENMETILMDDNFLSTTDGLPSSLTTLSNLKKLRLSYNLIGGPLNDDMFQSLSKLTHLEIESNFLTGSIPASIGDLKDLVYLYLRRNSMEFNLDFVKSGNLKSLFAMWLDANKITGTLPTELGELTDLASLSITNGTLTGKIPTELGSLSSLRRLWLYGNKLTGGIPAQFTNLEFLEVLEVQRNDLAGIMPEQVCAIVQGQSYEHKSLTADCTELVCATPGCCTHCH